MSAPRAVAVAPGSMVTPRMATPSQASAPPPQPFAPPPRQVQGSQPPARPITRPPPAIERGAIDEPSLSLPMVARRPWGLIVLVLLFDIGLAVAGAWMLTAGLGDRGSPPQSKAP